MSKYTEDDLKVELENKEYEYGFFTDIESETFPIGLNEDIVRAISKKKEEPQWMTNWRIEAFRAWTEMEEPEWANVNYEKPDFQAISYYSAPKKKDKYESLDEVDPELLETFKKLGISLDEQKKLAGVAMDIVVDSVSVATTFKKTLAVCKKHPTLNDNCNDCWSVCLSVSLSVGVFKDLFVIYLSLYQLLVNNAYHCHQYIYHKQKKRLITFIKGRSKIRL